MCFSNCATAGLTTTTVGNIFRSKCLSSTGTQTMSDDILLRKSTVDVALYSQFHVRRSGQIPQICLQSLKRTVRERNAAFS